MNRPVDRVFEQHEHPADLIRLGTKGQEYSNQRSAEANGVIWIRSSAIRTLGVDAVRVLRATGLGPHAHSTPRRGRR